MLGKKNTVHLPCWSDFEILRLTNDSLLTIDASDFYLCRLRKACLVMGPLNLFVRTHEWALGGYFKFLNKPHLHIKGANKRKMRFELRVRLAPLNRIKPSSKIFYWPFQGGTSYVDLLCLCFCSVLCLLCLCACLFLCALWSPAGKGLTSWLSFVVSNCEFVTFPLVSWVSRGTSLYRFLTFAPLLTYSLKLSGICWVLTLSWLLFLTL